MPCCLPYGKAGGLQILCCQGINVTDYNFNLDALALKPSDFCNVRVKSAGMKKIGIMSTPLEQKSSLEEIEKRFDNDVARFSNLETEQSATVDAPLAMELITERKYLNTLIRKIHQSQSLINWSCFVK